MNNINYNLKRHIKLLKRKEILKSQDKSLLKESKEENFELSGYNIAVENHIYWQDRFKIASLIQSFLNKEITEDEFCSIVFELHHTYVVKN